MAIGGGGTAVCKKYLKFRDTVPEKLTFPETQVDEPIWLFWNTGLEQAPEIVKTCYQSITKYAGRQVVLLTENNVQNYINMPDAGKSYLAIAIVNLPPRKMMGIDSEGMLISAVHEEDGHEGLNLLMVNDRIPAGAKLY